ncbi:MAG TPA: hypothetical protein VFI25_02100 [Planctomycetota bacterium]|jgi:hypothetical protein|nr:hypothetical protein [Planctomycetota bacterium]
MRRETGKRILGDLQTSRREEETRGRRYAQALHRETQALEGATRAHRDLAQEVLELLDLVGADGGAAESLRRRLLGLKRREGRLAETVAQVRSAEESRLRAEQKFREANSRSASLRQIWNHLLDEVAPTPSRRSAKGKEARATPDAAGREGPSRGEGPSKE